MGGQEGKPIVLFYPRGSASVKRTSPTIQVAHPVLRYSRRISAPPDVRRAYNPVCSRTSVGEVRPRRRFRGLDHRRERRVGVGELTLMAGTGAPPGTEPARTTTCHIGKFVPAATLQRWQMSGYSTSRTNSRVRTGNIGLHHLHHLAHL